MDNKETMAKNVKDWILAWKVAGSRMEQLRHKEMPLTNTVSSLMNLSDAFESCRLKGELRQSSGFLEQQFYFSKLRQ